MSCITEQIIDDKTFGLKNKNKSKKVMRYVAEVTKTTKASFVDVKQQKMEDIKAKQKADKKAHKEEMAALYKVSIMQPKVNLLSILNDLISFKPCMPLGSFWRRPENNCMRAFQGRSV